MLTVRDVAKRLNLSVPCVYTLVRGGTLPHYRLGGRRRAIRIRQDDVDAYLERCRVEPGEMTKVSPPSRKLKHIHI